MTVKQFRFIYLTLLWKTFCWLFLRHSRGLFFRRSGSVCVWFHFRPFLHLVKWRNCQISSMFCHFVICFNNSLHIWHSFWGAFCECLQWFVRFWYSICSWSIPVILGPNSLLALSSEVGVFIRITEKELRRFMVAVQSYSHTLMQMYTCPNPLDDLRCNFEVPRWFFRRIVASTSCFVVGRWYCGRYEGSMFFNVLEKFLITSCQYPCMRRLGVCSAKPNREPRFPLPILKTLSWLLLCVPICWIGRRWRLHMHCDVVFG